MDLFDKPPYGIFLLLDEATMLKSSEDQQLLENGKNLDEQSLLKPRNQLLRDILLFIQRQSRKEERRE